MRVPRSTSKVVLILGGICILMSLFTLILLPQQIMGRCDEAPNSCRPPTMVTALSIAHLHPGFGPAFEEAIETGQLVKNARTREGNVQYDVNRETDSPDVYRIVQKWNTIFERRSFALEVEKPFFNSPVMARILVDGKLTEEEELASSRPGHCQEKDNGAFSLTVKADCNAVWAVVSKWDDCSWVSDCAYAVVTDATRAVHHKDGHISTNETLLSTDPKTKTVIYSGSMIQGFVASLSLVSEGSGCRINYAFAKDRNEGHPTVGDILVDANLNRIPHMEKRFSS